MYVITPHSNPNGGWKFHVHLEDDNSRYDGYWFLHRYHAQVRRDSLNRTLEAGI